jgi:hypothetical protein
MVEGVGAAEVAHEVGFPRRERLADAGPLVDHPRTDRA